MKNILFTGCMCAFLTLCSATVGEKAYTVQVRNGVPRICVDDKVIPSRIFGANYYWGRLYNPAGEADQVIPPQMKMLKDCGGQIFTFAVPAIWTDEDDESRRGLVDFMDNLLKKDPDAKVIFRVRLYAPEWWLNKHPETAVAFSTPEFPAGIRKDGSVSSELYRRTCVEALRRTIRFLEERYPEHIAGYHPGGTATGEWFSIGAHNQFFGGYDDGTRLAWRRFLKNKYGNDNALQKAWHSPDVRLDTVEIPSPERRKWTVKDALISPEKAQDLIDFAEMRSEEMADMVLALGKVIREECGRRRLSVLFFGYLWEFSALWNGPANSAHLSFRRVLDSTYFDIFCAPFSYMERGYGGSVHRMAPTGSVMLAGKLWLNEDDTCTYIGAALKSKAAGNDAAGTDAAQSKLLLTRNLAAGLAGNYAEWKLDLYGRGWFNDPLLWEPAHEFRTLEKELLENPQATVPDVGVFIDPVSFRYIAGTGGARVSTLFSVFRARNFLSKACLSYEQYMLDDLLSGRVHTKLNIYSGVFALNGNDRKKLREFAGKSASIWCWGAGYVDLDTGKFSAQAVEELTGFKVRPAAEGNTFKVKATDAGRAIGLPASFGNPDVVYPLHAVETEPEDIVYAVYDDGSPAVVLRKKISPALFCGVPVVPAPLYREMAKLAGIHQYTSRDLYLYKHPLFTAFCAPAADRYVIDMGKRGNYVSPVDGKVFGEGPILFIPMEKGETVVIQDKAGK
ncbi:MAG: beta-galactosidase [Lentisphaeria bacterium]|nr:beta-galactosidase [Lentisphaeria bacterium]